jgi:4-hydroxythreonine-4-phosphate dehydrogenase
MPPLELAVTAGCPSGIGPEVTVRALDLVAPRRSHVRFVVFGDAGALRDAAARASIELVRHDNVRVVPVTDLSGEDRRLGLPGLAAGRAQLAAIDAALDGVLSGALHGIVTGPVSKRAITDAGVAFKGHTEHLAARAGVHRVVMHFAGPKLRVSLVTTHHSLADVPSKITREAVRETIVITARALVTDFGLRAPRIAVAGLNPHAGEGGMLGREELDVIGPAMADARASLDGLAVIGPVPAEAVFRQARDGRYDAVVAMYHDQATIASKLLDFGDAVNVTLGLPFVRTSVDHGTAYDIAGQNLADPHGMEVALELGASLATTRRAAATVDP